jgi:hypothetical protein
VLIAEIAMVCGGPVQGRVSGKELGEALGTYLSHLIYLELGKVAERLNATVLKTVIPRGIQGSNPCLSVQCIPGDSCYAVERRAI